MQKRSKPSTLPPSTMARGSTSAGRRDEPRLQILTLRWRRRFNHPTSRWLSVHVRGSFAKTAGLFSMSALLSELLPSFCYTDQAAVAQEVRQ